MGNAGQPRLRRYLGAARRNPARWPRAGPRRDRHRQTWPQGRSVSSAARERARELGRIIGRRLEFEPRRRQDIDIVFMAAYSADARQLMPQLAFHHGADLPVHATSHVWVRRARSGQRPRPRRRGVRRHALAGRADRKRSPPAGTDRDRARRTRPGPAAAVRLRRRRVPARDGACGVSPTSGPRALMDTPGRLTMAANHRISRRLAWARFVDGIPAPWQPEVTGVEPSKPSPVR